MTEETKEAIQKVIKRKQRQPFFNAILLIGLVAALSAVGIIFFATIPQRDRAIDRLGIGLDQVNSSLKTVCQQADPAKKTTLPVGVKDDCARAEVDQKPPIVQDTPAVAPPSVDLPTLYAAVRTVVSQEIAANPPKDGEAPPPEQILGLIRRVYEDNKPADGKTPSDEELLVLVKQVYADNKPADGKNGQDATQDQADLAIAKYCGRPEKPCVGPVGPAGAKGVDAPRAVSMVFAYRNGDCVMEVAFNDGSVIRAEVNGGQAAQVALCGEPAPPTSSSASPPTN